jgi:hypothetical protein
VNAGVGREGDENWTKRKEAAISITRRAHNGREWDGWVGRTGESHMSAMPFSLTLNHGKLESNL